MTISEIYNILESSKKLSFEEYNYLVAIFLSTQELNIKKDLKAYIRSHSIEFSYNDNVIEIDGHKYTIYDSDEVNGLITDAIEYMCRDVRCALGDNSQYFDFNNFIEDNPISIELALNCTEYEAVYDNGGEYYIAKW